MGNQNSAEDIVQDGNPDQMIKSSEIEESSTSLMVDKDIEIKTTVIADDDASCDEIITSSLGNIAVCSNIDELAKESTESIEIKNSNLNEEENTENKLSGDDVIEHNDSLKNLKTNIRRKTSNLVAPQNIEITNYCRNLINVSFHGQVTLKARLELYHLLDEGSSYTLAALLQSMHSFLKSFGDSISELTGDEEEFIYYVQGFMERRNQNDMQKFWMDARKFLEVYKDRKILSEDLNHTNYWGTRQQLLAGKVIADFVDKDYGPLDPVFGILLCPVAGRAGPGDSGIVHEILFDDDGPLAYHSAAHDAFGYLLTHHNVGPGYNYLGAGCELLKASRCMSGQISGLYFWRDILKTEKSETKFSLA